MDQNRLKELLDKYKNETASAAERRELLSWYRDTADQPSAFPEDESATEARMLGRLQSAIAPARTNSFIVKRIAAAASILLFVSAGAYLVLRPKKISEEVALQRHDIQPGHNQATLTLANGQKITLTKGLSGRLAMQNNTIISASQNTITYQPGHKGGQLIYNMLSTAKGEQSPYPLVLADGTKVWLNAESSITFPTAFNGDLRTVKVTGEVYFEVMHHDQQPFTVQTAKETIKDIGTHFNVNAYPDENNSTTLLEGSVKVDDLTLQPGQQSDGKTIKKVSTSQVIAWKNGDFDFQNDNIQTIMRQLSRWYDIDVTYQGSSNELFNAQISRRQNISVILLALERTGGVRFKIEGRRVTVIE